jgi:hypothetical protein
MREHREQFAGKVKERLLLHELKVRGRLAMIEENKSQERSWQAYLKHFSIW